MEAVKNKARRPLVVIKFFQREVTSHRQPNRTQRSAGTTATTACSWNTQHCSMAAAVLQRDTRRGDAHFCSSVFTRPHFKGAGWPDRAAPCSTVHCHRAGCRCSTPCSLCGLQSTRRGSQGEEKQTGSSLCCQRHCVQGVCRGVRQVQFNMEFL